MNNSIEKQLRIRKIFADPMDFINQAIRVTIKTNNAYYFKEFLALYRAACRFLTEEGYLKRATKGKYKGRRVVCKGWHARPLDLWSKQKREVLR